MQPKRKPLGMMIALEFGKKKPGMSGERQAEGEDTEEEEAPSGGKYDDEGMISASEDMLDAMKSRDATALNRALCEWHEMHKAYEDDGDEESESGSEEDKDKDY